MDKYNTNRLHENQRSSIQDVKNVRYRVTYNRFRNLLNTPSKDAKAEYFANIFDENEANIKETWKTILYVIKTNHKFNDIIQFMVSFYNIINRYPGFFNITFIFIKSICKIFCFSISYLCIK